MYGEAALVKSFIHEWWHRFNNGRKSSERDTRPGRLVLEEKCAAVESYVMKDRQVTVRKVDEKS